MFTAAEEGGLFSVRAEVASVEGIAEARIRSDAGMSDGGSDLDGGGSNGDYMSGRIQWKGEIPLQKWMNFYTKVLSRFASSPDLKLTVSFEVTSDPELARQKADEARNGLKELGLDDHLDVK